MKLASLLLPTLGLVLCSCAAPRRPPSETIAKAQPVLFEWRGDEVSGPLSIVISLDEQKAHIFRGGREVGWTYVATGKPGYSSPRGRFAVIEKLHLKISGRFGVIENAAGEVIDRDATSGREAIPPGGRFVGAPMPYWMGVTSFGVGMHAGPIPNPGHAASHGCIRLPREMAEKLYSVVKIGTPVTIQ